MTAPTKLNQKQQEIIRLHQLSPTFDLEKALEAVASKPRGRPAKVKAVEVEENVEVPFREGRFLLEHLENRHVPFVRKQCLACRREFLCNYKSVAFCDDVCRANHFHETYGFIWNPERSEAERWELWKEPPSVVKPETLRRLEAFARAILDIEPTPEDLSLPAPEFKIPDVLPKPSTGNASSSGQNSSTSNSVSSEPKRSEALTVTEREDSKDRGGLSNMGEIQRIKARFKAGEITAHELQEQLAAALRG